MKGRATLGLAVLLVAILPTAPAEAQSPGTGCQRQCDPKGPDVNASPPQTGGNVNVIMFAHYQDILHAAPLNTIAPDPAHEKDLKGGFLMPVLVTRTGAGCQVGNCVDFAFKNNAFLWSFCPGSVEFKTDGWRLNCHSRQMAASIVLGASSIPVYFYVSTNAVPIEDGSVPKVGVMPQVGLYARLSQGKGPGDIVVAESPTPEGLGSTTLVSVPGQPNVYELRADMRVLRQSIEKDGSDETPGFMVEVVPYQARTSMAEVAQSSWRIHTGPNFPPRAILPIMNPLDAQPPSITLNGTNLRSTILVTDALGSYDINISSARMRVWSDRELPASAPRLASSYRNTDHDGVGKPVAFHHDIILGDGAKGNYTVEFRVQNGQGTFELVRRASFDFTEIEGTNTLPVPGALAAVLALGLVGVLRRRS